MSLAAAGQTVDPLDLLVVASWYPAVDDPTAGRFVADQAEALSDSGRARPIVASFEPCAVSGGPAAKRQQLTALENAAASAVAGHPDPISARAWGSDRAVGIARLPIAVGGLGRGEPDRPSQRRANVLKPFAERLIAEGRAPALVHAHTCFPDGAAAAEVCQKIGWPLVITEHASFVQRLLGDADTAARYREAATAAARFVCVSRMLADEILAVLPELEPRLVVIPNLVAVSDFTLGDPPARRPDELLFVGYRKPTKGIDHLLETFARVRASRPQAVLRMIGSSPTEEVEEGWRRRSRELGIADAVSLEPAADRATVAEAMRRAALFVHPSPRETFGVVAVEALCSGLPVVATASGGLDEILGDEPRALGDLVPVGDPAALAAAVLDALERRDTFDPSALRASVEQRFGAPLVAQRLLALYEEVLHEASRSARPAPSAASSPPLSAQSPSSMPVGASPESLMHRPASAAADAGQGQRPPGQEAGARLVVVVGLDARHAAKAIGFLPDELRAGLALVTGRDDGTPLPGGLRQVLTVKGPAGAAPRAQPGRPGALGRIERLLRDPVGVLRRRLGGPATDRGLAEARQALSTLLGDASREPATEPPLDLICLDAIDYVVVQPFVADAHVLAGVRVRLAPGGCRWLADRWWTSQEDRRGPTADPLGSGSRQRAACP